MSKHTFGHDVLNWNYRSGGFLKKLNQGDYQAFAKDPRGIKKALKKTRKAIAKDYDKQFGPKRINKTLHQDINKRGKYKIKFIRKHGRVIPIRVKQDK
jgi:hypothetical protein